MSGETHAWHEVRVHAYGVEGFQVESNGQGHSLKPQRMTASITEDNMNPDSSMVGVDTRQLQTLLPS